MAAAHRCLATGASLEEGGLVGRRNWNGWGVGASAAGKVGSGGMTSGANAARCVLVMCGGDLAVASAVGRNGEGRASGASAAWERAFRGEAAVEGPSGASAADVSGYGGMASGTSAARERGGRQGVVSLECR